MLVPDGISTDQNRRISEILAREQAKLRQFIRKRVPNEGDAEDIFQDVFYELVAAYRLMKPVEQAGAWLFRVARNRIIDLFRHKRPVVLGNGSIPLPEDGEARQWEELLPSPEAGPEALYARSILLEELDAFLHDREKALVLNVLDGSESSINDKGTLLIATTNYPEAIDERVLKRPGRLDRIFIIPETRRREDAEKMLKQYLGMMWNDDHKALVQRLVGYPGAFIREVAIFALIQVAYEDLDVLPLPLLEKSYNSLKEQIDVRDDFLTKRGSAGFGFFGSNGDEHEAEYE